MANSIGLVDSGYRGEVQAKMDVLNYDTDANPFEDGPDGCRLFQICQHNFLPWKSIILVKYMDELPTASDTRGTGGFGSTGASTDGGVSLGYVR